MVTPFPYQELKSFSASEARLQSFLAKRLPRGLENSPALTKLSAQVSRLLGADFSIRLDSFSQTTFSLLKTSLPADPVVLVISLTPHPQKIIIEAGFDMAALVIDRLLGGGGHVGSNLRSLTTLEEGVIEYFALKILSEIEPLLSQNAGGLCLEKLVTSSNHFPELSKPQDVYAQLHFKVYAKPHRSYLRLSLPLSLLESLMTTSLFSDPAGKSHDLSEADFKTVLWAEAGRVSLTPEELNQLERDDIVLFDETVAHLDGGHLGGAVKLWVGDGTHGGFEAVIGNAGAADHYQLKLKKVFHSHS